MAPKKEKQIISPDKLMLYDKLISANSAIERKGATLPYTSVNGNMFTFLSGDGDLNIRLPDIEREKFIKKFKTCLSVQHGVTMKEYVVVPESLFKRISVIQTYVDLSFLCPIVKTKSFKEKITVNELHLLMNK